MSPRLVETSLASLTPPSLRHEHSWELQAVTHEDGVVFEEFGCAGCGELTFR